MTSTALVDINGAVVTAWKTLLPYPCSYEAEGSTPPAGAKWTAITMLPVSALPAAIGINSPIEHVTLVQFDINTPLGSGAVTLLQDADTVSNTFYPGATIQYGSIILHCEYCQRSQIRRTDNNSVLSLTVKFRGWQFR